MLPLPHALSFGVMEFLKLSTITTKRDVGSSSAVFSNQPISEGNMRLESLLIHFCYVAAIRTLFGEGNGALAMKITVFHYFHSPVYIKNLLITDSNHTNNSVCPLTNRALRCYKPTISLTAAVAAVLIGLLISFFLSLHLCMQLQNNCVESYLKFLLFFT